MKCLKIRGLLIAALLVSLTSCDSPIGTAEYESLSTESAFEEMAGINLTDTKLKSTGEFWAEWKGCDKDHDDSDGHGCNCSGGHDDTTHDHTINSEDEHSDDNHGGHGGSKARPARDFYLQFHAQLFKDVKGYVNFRGVSDDEGVEFYGPVTWIQAGRETNEIVFGGEVEGGTVQRNCFLFSVQDNGEGANMEADRLQYRLYGSSHAPCHLPDHFPKGFPIELYQGNLQVH